MVEGPGATRNGRKLKSAVGYAVDHVEQAHLQEKLQGRLLVDVISVGKEVFLLFANQKRDEDVPEDEVALRLHFGMNGCLSLHNRGEGASAFAPWRRRTVSSLKICFVSPSNLASRMCLETKDSNANFLSARVARSKVTRLARRDVCGDDFDPAAVLDAIVEKRGNSLISDAILDQERFPGVGNIIKIEGLHKAKVHPKRVVSTLTQDELQAVISNCRIYAIGWLSSGRAPMKSVYDKTVCGTCSALSVRMVKLGNDLSRTTFWCEFCQPLSGGKRHPNKSSNDRKCRPTIGVNVLQTKQCCPQHGASPLLLRRVKKANSSNRNRLFRICKVRSCPYFVWVDSHFPKCQCKKTTILRVSKTEKTGGRWFFSCRDSGQQHGKDTRGCKYFDWADELHLLRLGAGLTPLL